MSDIKYLGDGTAVLVVGPAPDQATSTDGGRTTIDVPHTYVSFLGVEAVDNDQLHDSPPQPEPDVSEAQPVPGRGDAQNADELQAEIDSLKAQLAEAQASSQAAHPPTQQ